jgi:hypothetical protein
MQAIHITLVAKFIGTEINLVMDQPTQHSPESYVYYLKFSSEEIDNIKKPSL